MTDRLDPEQTRECVMLANVGVNHGFAPARLASTPNARWRSNCRKEAGGGGDCFATGRGEDVSAAGGARLRIRLPADRTHRARMATRLRLAAPLRRSGRVGAAAGRRWQLAWTLAEIADKQVIAVAEGVLTTIVGETRPSDVSFRLRELVTLEVNEAGSVNSPSSTVTTRPVNAYRRGGSAGNGKTSCDDGAPRTESQLETASGPRPRAIVRLHGFPSVRRDPAVRLVGRARRVHCHPGRPVLPGTGPIAAEFRPGRLAAGIEVVITCSNKGSVAGAPARTSRRSGRTSVRRPGGPSAARCASTCHQRARARRRKFSAGNEKSTTPNERPGRQAGGATDQGLGRGRRRAGALRSRAGDVGPREIGADKQQGIVGRRGRPYDRQSPKLRFAGCRPRPKRRKASIAASYCVRRTRPP